MHIEDTKLSIGQYVSMATYCFRISMVPGCTLGKLVFATASYVRNMNSRHVREYMYHRKPSIKAYGANFNPPKQLNICAGDFCSKYQLKYIVS